MTPPSDPISTDDLARRAPALRNGQGREFEAAGDLGRAMEAYRQALSHDPRYRPAAANLARLLVAQDRPREATALLEPIAASAPYDMPLAVNYANALLGIGRAEEAEQRLRAVTASPDAPAQAQNSLGIARYVQRNYPGAADAFRRAVSAAPDFAEAHENLAHALLQQRRYTEAWPEYEWRWRNPSNALTKRAFKQAIWDGAPLDGRTLLLHAEQGLGDTIQFVRFADLITKSGGKIVLVCQPRLTACLAGIAGIDQILAHGDPLPDFDIWTPLLSLPRLLGTTFETIPDSSPYIHATAESSVPNADGIARIGINWVGRPLHGDDPARNRSCPLSHFAALARTPDLRLYSLHFGPLDVAPSEHTGIDFSLRHDDFADSARLVAAMDLIVTVDTALAHLAGAMARPCWVLLPYAPDWRWAPRSDGSQPWYRSIRVFRQPTPGDWASVFQEVAQALTLNVVDRITKN